MRSLPLTFLAIALCTACGFDDAIEIGGVDPDDADDEDDVPHEDLPSLDEGPVDVIFAIPGEQLWTSAAWSNGQARTVTSHGSYDPDDAKLQVAAGTGRKWSTAGDGTSKLEGNRSRIYIHAGHRNVELVFEANATDTRLENISTKVRSRHNQGGSKSNRFGGYGVAFNLEDQVADFKIESFHNSHESSRKHELPRQLHYNHWYRYKVTIQERDNNAKAVVKAYIDYDLDGTWTWVGTETYSRTGYRKNDMNAKYVWIRANSGDEVQKGLLLRNGQLTEISPL